MILFDALALGGKQAILTEEEASERETNMNKRQVQMKQLSGRIDSNSALESTTVVGPNRGMVLPFTPLAMSFDSVNYYVDMPNVRVQFFLDLT